jgi:hypothetical protein
MHAHPLEERVAVDIAFVRTSRDRMRDVIAVDAEKLIDGAGRGPRVRDDVLEQQHEQLCPRKELEPALQMRGVTPLFHV